MTKKIFRSTVPVGLAVLLASLVIIMGALYTYFGHVQEQQLRDELSIAAAAMESGDGEAYLSKLHSDNYRITWLRADGTVLYDTKADAAAMENHAQREEVRQALTNGTGESSRYSATLLEKTLYYARRLPDGTVLRLSASRVTMGVLLLSMFPAILAVIAVALILSGILAGRVSRRITRPLNTLDLEHPLENDAYEELSPLLRRLEHQRRQIDDQLRSLRRRSEEFEQITASMTEGLVLVDNGGTILSMNPAACAVFHTDAACVGQPLLTVERGSAVSHALHDAMDTGHGETRMERDGREYQFDMTRIQADGEVVGAVLLTFDVTEQAYAERNRREFTANVSHELKTPLQGIIGSAELLEKAGKAVVIDHHRRAVDSIQNPTLNYLEAGSSSACEMVTEVIQYFDDGLKPTTFECGALLAGITMDTKHFSFNTGARTFEAASYLRRNGADNTTVKMMFQDDMQTYRSRAKVVESAILMEQGIAISACPPDSGYSPLIAAQAADELISIKGIQASFVLAEREGAISISGRSLGEINVQLILEKLGGGGHLAVAGAQLKGATMDAAVNRLTQAVHEYLQESGMGQP